jgi:hypothetical protein
MNFNVKSTVLKDFNSIFSSKTLNLPRQKHQTNNDNPMLSYCLRQSSSHFTLTRPGSLNEDVSFIHSVF